MSQFKQKEVSTPKIQNTSVAEYPKFISNSPCAEDLFEGKAHQKIAQNIANILENNRDCHIIGIEGEWGSGKSNLVKLVEKAIRQIVLESKSKPKYHFFLYDAWGFQNDFQRRSILENLTVYLVDNEKLLDSGKWNGKLLKLLSRKRNVGSKVVKELNALSKIGSVTALLFPVYIAIYNLIPENWKKIRFLYLAVIFIASLAFIIILQISDMKKYGQTISFANILHDLFYSFLDYTENKDNVEQAIKYETIYESEPSSRDFKNWMQEIDKDLSNKHKLIIIFDNMDRLPAKKVQELWSAINSFFSEQIYDNIKVIIPFDRNHIRSAFKGENIEKICDPNSEDNFYGDDFIDKTFNIVFRVSPPTMTNWQKYFTDKWHEAFGTDVDGSVLQIYDLLSKNQTPRKIIAFINEFVEIKLLFETSIPDKYIALFIFGKAEIQKNPSTEILSPSYLGALDFLYKDDEQLPKYISALYYQLSPENALDIIYTEKIKKALDNKNSDEILGIKKLSIFYNLLRNAITRMSNIPNAIIALNECFGEETDAEQQQIWDCFYKKATKAEDSLQEYQKVLVQKISQKDSYLKKIIHDFYSTQNFSTIEYYKSIKELSDLPGIDLGKYLYEKEVEPQDYIAFVEEAKDSYENFKIKCSSQKLDDYLSTLTIEQLKSLSALQFAKYQYDDLPKYMDSLKKLVDQNSADKQNMAILFERLKEIQRPIEKKIPDNILYSLFQKAKPEENFYYDLICMRFARGTSLSSSNDSLFNSVFNSQDEEIIARVSERLEYYATYGEILINLKIMGRYPLYKACAKELTEKRFGQSTASIAELLKNYKDIKTNLDINADILINRFNGWAKFAQTEVTLDNISKIPVDFFEDAKTIKNNLTSHCKKIADEYLAQERTVDEWKDILRGEKYECKLLLAVEARNESCFRAFKRLLTEYAENPAVPLSKDLCQKIIDLALKNDRQLKVAFNDVRDVFCAGRGTMTPELFSFFGDWLFSYADLDRKEIARTIFTPQVLDNSGNIEFILSHQEKMIKIIEVSDEEGIDFKNTFSDIVKRKYADNQEVIKFAESIGITIQSIENEAEDA